MTPYGLYRRLRAMFLYLWSAPDEVQQLRQKVACLEGQVNNLRVQVDVLRDIRARQSLSRSRL